METELKIPIPNTNKHIYAKQRGSLDAPVIVFVHGLTGHMDEHQFYNGARAVETAGFSSLRFNLYDFWDDARKLHECTLITHAQDLDTVIAYLRGQGAKQIFVVGHSYGGPTILLSQNKDFEAVVLWEPAHQESFENEAYYVKEINDYLIKWQAEIRISRGMYNEPDELDWDNFIPSLHIPVKIIAASESNIIKHSKKYFAQANEPKELTVIKGAGHTFSENGTADQLYQQTIDWFSKYK